MNKLRLRFGLKEALTQACAERPDPQSILWMRIFNRIQLSVREISLISATVLDRRPCWFLVFGLGNDSLYWELLNRGGRTVFIEDNPGWWHRIRAIHPHLTIHLVQYNTKRSEWRHLLTRPKELVLAFPAAMRSHSWDVILVDAPNGWRDAHPGRMKSIFQSAQLVSPSGDIFVHDCNRTVERIYCSKFLGNENLVASAGRLRHYRMDQMPSQSFGQNVRHAPRFPFQDRD